MSQKLDCFRYFLVGGACIVGICGLIESVCASYFLYQLFEYSPLTPSHVCGSAITLLVIGLITCTIGWCAWQFVNFKNKCQVIIFYIALIIIAMVNTSAGIWALVRREQVDLLPAEHLKKVFALATTDDKPLWDHMHSKIHCCGLNGPGDYQGQEAIPWSCCDTSSTVNVSDNKGACTTMYSHGCQHVVLNHTKTILIHIFLLALCTILLQVCFIACMSCYVKACREKENSRVAMQTYGVRTSNDLRTEQSLLNQQSKYSKPDNA